MNSFGARVGVDSKVRNRAIDIRKKESSLAKININ